MKVQLAYGRAGLDVSIPEDLDIQVLREKEVPHLCDPAGALDEALYSPLGSAPLRDLANRRRNAVVVISDITRPVPNRLLLPAVLREIEQGDGRRIRPAGSDVPGRRTPASKNRLMLFWMRPR